MVLVVLIVGYAVYVTVWLQDFSGEDFSQRDARKGLRRVFFFFFCRAEEACCQMKTDFFNSVDLPVWHL